MAMAREHFLREQAQGRDCQVRAPGCNFNRETTVLAHLNGMGKSQSQKNHDLLGAWACSACHDFVDNRAGVAAATTRRIYHLEGMARTLAVLLAEGKIIITDSSQHE